MLRKQWIGAAALFAAALMLVGSAAAQVGVPRDTERDTQAPAAQPADPQAPEQQQARMHPLRADDIIGMRVGNAEGENLGNINDLVIRTDKGEIAYAAVSFGGFLGFGDKLFAVPWQSFRMEQRGDDETHLVFNIDRARLENAPGFDQRNWPEVADPKWQKTVDDYYQVERGDARRGVGVDVKVDRNGVAVRTNRTDETAATQPAERRPVDTTAPAETGVAKQTLEHNPHAMRASEIQGMTIQNQTGDDLGNVNDIVINAHTGEVEYAVVAFGGFLGFGENLVAVPYEALGMRHKDRDRTIRDAVAGREYVMVLDMEESLLRKAPTLGADGYASFHQPAYRDSVDEFFSEVRVARQPATDTAPDRGIEQR